VKKLLLIFLICFSTTAHAEFKLHLVTEGNYHKQVNDNSGIEDVMTRRVPIGTKVWIRAACVCATGTTISVYYGVHEYEG